MESKLVNVFIQASTIRGYRYLDDAGKIMIEFDDEFPIKNIIADNLSGNTLSMVNGDAVLRHVRVTTQAIWVHFETPPTDQYVIDHATRVIRKVCDIIDVERFSRIGVRTQDVVFHEDFALLIQRARSLFFSPRVDEILRTTSHAIDDGNEGFQLAFPVRVGDMVVNLQTGSAQQADSDETGLPRKGLLIDIDMYREGELSEGEVRRFVRAAMNWVRQPVSSIMAAVTEEAG